MLVRRALGLALLSLSLFSAQGATSPGSASNNDTSDRGFDSSSGATDTIAPSPATATTAATAPTAVGDKLQWLDCDAYVPSPLRASAFECAALRVPVCHAQAPCGRGAQQIHTLEIKRRDISSEPSAPTVVIVYDTDDAISNSVIAMMDLIGQQAGGTTINVYALQTRLGRPPMGVVGDDDVAAPTDSPTPCGSLATSYGARTDLDGSTLAAVGTCYDWLRDTFGTNATNAFSLDAAAADLALALRVLRAYELQGNANVYVLAVGAASRVVDTFMDRHNASADGSIAGVILDSPHARTWAATQDTTTGESTTRFLDGCDADAFCRTKFESLGVNMRDVLRRAYATLDVSSPATTVSPCLAMLRDASVDDARDLMPSHGVRRFIMALRRRPDTYKLVAPLLYRVHRCDAVSDVARLTALFSALQSKTQLGVPLVFGERKASLVAFVERVVAYSALWPTTPVPTRDALVAAFEATLLNDGVLLTQLPSYCAYTASTASACVAVTKKTAARNASRVVTYATTRRSTRATWDTDVLLLASRLSTTGAAAVALERYDAVATTGGRTTIVVQTDTLAPLELGDVATADVLGLVGRFVTQQARDWNGKWHVTDLTATTATAAVSTFATAPVSVAFALSNDDVRTWFSYGKNSDADAYEDKRTAESGTSCVVSCAGTNWSLYAWVGGVVAVGLVVVVAGCAVVNRRRRRGLSGRLDAGCHTHEVDATPPPPSQWVAEPASEYAWSYTRAPNAGSTKASSHTTAQ